MCSDVPRMAREIPLQHIRMAMIQFRVVECSFLVPIQRDVNLSDGELHSTDFVGVVGLVEFIEAHEHETS